ncbi:MAG TPA: hypothetical protein VF903_10635 [Nitrospirota bacterium]
MKKIVFLSALVIIGVLFAAQIRRGALSMLILIDSVRPAEKPVMGEFISGPAKTKVTLPGERPLHADLYRPKKEGRLFPLLLVHGVNPSGKDDKRIVLLAEDLARAGFLVLVPDLEGMRSLRMRISDAEDVLRSFRYLGKIEHAGPRGGMIGIGCGAGPMLLAAADSRIRDKVGVVATIDGYYEFRSVLLYEMTGSFEYGGQRGRERPDTSLRWLFAYRNLDLLRSIADREKLRKVIEHRNRYEIAAADALARTLGPEGRALYHFLINTDRDRFGPLYENLSLPVREYAYQLSPSRAIPSITASFVIVHGTDDYAVPYTESLRLAEAVGPRRVHLALLPQFMHGEPAEASVTDWFKRYVLGYWRLFSAISALLEKGGI